jgi:hypothetical protein
MRRFAIALIVAFGLSTPNLHAGVSDTGPTDTPSELKLSRDGLLGAPKGLDFKGLLTSDRLTFRNTVGISFRSGAFGGMSQYYLNTITYRASKPLVIRAQVGIENTMFGQSRALSGTGGGTRLVVPYLGVQYRPLENLTIDISISHMPAHYGYDGGYRY